MALQTQTRSDHPDGGPNIFYTSEPDRALELIAELKPRITSHSIRAHADEDPDWQFYRKFAMNGG